ncbi:DNA invertase Pin-like site-specific DNA recombinase [Parabacteroides sp. PF5-5]|nr:DNA invertase Pin-like site-specific DNA recombinase [Parabacteroides sp. PF5-5]
MVYDIISYLCIKSGKRVINMKTQQKFVAYYRTSKKGQDLGIDAQKNTVKDYTKRIDGIIIDSYEEQESGKHNERIELHKALESCKRNKATIIIAKLDRLSRNVEFLFNVRNSGIDICCVDMPQLNTLTLGIFASLAQYERELISERTKKALQAKKQKGALLGKPNNLRDNLDQAIENSKATRKNKAYDNENNKRAYAFIKSLKEQNKTWAEIMRELNKAGFYTSKGKTFTIKAIQRVHLLFDSKC